MYIHTYIHTYMHIHTYTCILRYGFRVEMSPRASCGILSLSSSLLSFEHGEYVEQLDGLSHIESDGFKGRVAKMLELAFRKVKVAGEYTNIEQPWLRDGERLVVLLTGYQCQLTNSPPATPLAYDADYAYLLVSCLRLLFSNSCRNICHVHLNHTEK